MTIKFDDGPTTVTFPAERGRYKIEASKPGQTIKLVTPAGWLCRVDSEGWFEVRPTLWTRLLLALRRRL